MCWKTWMFAGGLLAGVGATALPGLAQERTGLPPRHGHPAEEQRYANQWLDEIRDATSPSAAVDAYARAIERVRRDGAVEHEYMHKMIDFGLPELAEQQARSVVDRRPRDGTARAVAAYMNARRGTDVAALQEIVVAADLSPGEPFVQRTAGQLLAWLDLRMDARQLPSELVGSVERMRRRFRGTPEFHQAYATTRDTYRRGTRVREPFGVFPAAIESDPFDGRWAERVEPDRERRDRFDRDDRDDRRWWPD
jgi:hypothetical protein